MNDEVPETHANEMLDAPLVDKKDMVDVATKLTGAPLAHGTVKSPPCTSQMSQSGQSNAGDETYVQPSGRKRQFDVSDGPWGTNKLENKYDRVGTPRIVSATSNIIIADVETHISPNMTHERTLPSKNSAKKVFSLMDAFCKDNDLLLLLISYLTIPGLINFYAMSKQFHYLFNRHTTAFILSISRTWAPRAEVIYPWRYYQSLCHKDPVLREKDNQKRQKTQRLNNGKHAEVRDVPSLRWLQMVVYRQGVCKDILVQMAARGLRCPKGALDAVRRMWFFLDQPLNCQRIALARNTTYITNSTIMAATMVFLKLDMFFTDPAGKVYGHAQPHTNLQAYPQTWEGAGFVGCDLRELLLAEKSLTPVWRVLRGWSWDHREGAVPMNRIDIVRLWVRHKYKLPEDAPEHVQKQSIVGVPWWEVGTAGLERTGVAMVQVTKTTKQPIIHPGLVSQATESQHLSQQLLQPHQQRIIVPEVKTREVLLRPDQLVLREGIRRQMGVHRHWARMMLWGFCDEVGRTYKELSEDEILQWSHGKKPEKMFEPLRRKRDKVVATSENEDQEKGTTSTG